MTHTGNYLAHFCIAGINYRKSDIKVRGKFSLTTEQCEQLLKEVVIKNFPELWLYLPVTELRYMVLLHRQKS